MTKEEIIEMANKYFFSIEYDDGVVHEFYEFSFEELVDFVKVIAEREREECAKVCDAMDSISDYYTLRVELVCAQAIRARGQE